MLKKSLTLALALLNLLPSSKPNRFKDIFITPISDKQYISFSFIVNNPCDTEFKIYVETPGCQDTYLYRNKVYILLNFSDQFLLPKEIIFDNSCLIFMAKSNTSSSFLRFDLKVQNPLYNLNEYTTFTMEDALQYLDDRETIHYAQETLNFNNLANNLVLSRPFLPFSHISITQESNFYMDYLTFDEIVMRILDKENLFSLFKHKNNYVDIRLELEKIGQNYKLSLLDKLYVHNEKLLLSSQPKEGFVRTNYIYLPKNCTKRLFKIEIQFKNLGIQKINCKYDYNIEIKEKYFGSCSTAKHCVQIEESLNLSEKNKVEVFL